MSKAAPEFSRRTLDGTRIETGTLRGRVVVVKFFAKYCEPCQRTLPALESLHRRHPELAIIGVAEDERRADVEEVVRRFSLTFPVVHDADNVLAGRYRVSALPATFVIDANGVVRWSGTEESRTTDLDWVSDLK